LDANEDEWTALETISSPEKRIDVWWWGDATSRLMLLLAYLMTRSETWNEAKIRVLAAGQEEGSAGTIEDLKKTLKEVRIEAEPEMVESPNADAIAERSGGSSLVFIPFRLRGNLLLGPFGGPLEGFLSRLPIVAMILAAEDIDLDAEPEEGKAGELAAALDTLTDAEKRAGQAEEEAAKAAKEADEKMQELESAIASGAGEDLMSKVKATLEAKEQASKAARRAAKALAKVEDAARAAEKLGAKPAKESEELNESSNSEGDKEPRLP
jgi:hypothetical protein